MPADSTMPKAEAMTVHASAGDAPPHEAGSAATGVYREPLVESHPADRAFHAALARLSGGISPIALLLAYTDWLSHLAASPQRQLEISQEAVRDGKRVFETAQHFFSPQQGPW